MFLTEDDSKGGSDQGLFPQCQDYIQESERGLTLPTLCLSFPSAFPYKVKAGGEGGEDDLSLSKWLALSILPMSRFESSKTLSSSLSSLDFLFSSFLCSFCDFLNAFSKEVSPPLVVRPEEFFVTLLPFFFSALSSIVTETSHQLSDSPVGRRVVVLSNLEISKLLVS
jgi:hypothetical protein